MRMSDDEEFRDIAEAAFDLARAGETDRLLAFVAAGLPVDLANGSGDSCSCSPPTTGTRPLSPR
nr:hypothetical protein GCM10025732_37440 [Glycomyces mayteni]